MPDKTPKEKKNSPLKDLLLLFAVPLFIIVAAAVVIYIPQWTANPAYDFVYATCNDYRCATTYSVDKDHIRTTTSNDSDVYAGNSVSPTLHYYDTQRSSTEDISYEDAQKLRLNPSSKSPDSYTLSKETSSGGFLFWSDYSQDWYLKNGAKKKKVELTQADSYYTDNVTFIGWVEK